MQSLNNNGGYSREIFLVLRSTLLAGFNGSAPNPAQPVLQFNEPNVTDANERTGLNTGPMTPDFDNEVFTWFVGQNSQNPAPSAGVPLGGDAKKRPLVLHSLYRHRQYSGQ